MKKPVVGVLALQGAFAKHLEMLRSLGAEAREVRKPEELKDCDALIIPGGESTAILKHIKFIGLTEAFHQFAKEKKPVFGTCAGLILMSQEIIGDEMEPFKLLEVSVERNAFGRQVESFKIPIELKLEGKQSKLFSAVFIRAPRIRACGPNVNVLASYEGEPVLVQQGPYLGATFHPELTQDSTIHAYFLKLISKN